MAGDLPTRILWDILLGFYICLFFASGFLSFFFCKRKQLSGQRLLLVFLIFLSLFRCWDCSYRVFFLYVGFDESHYNMLMYAVHHWYPAQAYLAAYSFLIYEWAKFFFFLQADNVEGVQRKCRIVTGVLVSVLFPNFVLSTLAVVMAWLDYTANFKFYQDIYFFTYSGVCLFLGLLHLMFPCLLIFITLKPDLVLLMVYYIFSELFPSTASASLEAIRRSRQARAEAARQEDDWMGDEDSHAGAVPKDAPPRPPTAHSKGRDRAFRLIITLPTGWNLGPEGQGLSYHHHHAHRLEDVPRGLLVKTHVNGCFIH
ncbi:hypothetical protein PAPYR_5504 [Paratrimastix pyriformis]|uniref:Uncharacterized protein n=1 Tax=Paratrimastix pyriformis TaxID=342808 RepID=A0ABQ8UIX1_9EUKA|nr:hypothetical protein PAPYR_5504 [Paratrimastix pyriformis]